MLAINPDVLLLDEPLSNLDAKLRLEMRTEMKRLHQTLKNTILYVTHVAVMHNGRILQYAPPLTIYRSPADLTVGFLYLLSRFFQTSRGDCGSEAEYRSRDQAQRPPRDSPGIIDTFPLAPIY